MTTTMTIHTLIHDHPDLVALAVFAVPATLFIFGIAADHKRITGVFPAFLEFFTVLVAGWAASAYFAAVALSIATLIGVLPDGFTKDDALHSIVTLGVSSALMFLALVLLSSPLRRRW